jgi:phenylacetate-CoA ligase
MEKVTGRSDDMIILRGVNIFPTQIEEQLLTIK